jgi:hypothetical protein
MSENTALDRFVETAKKNIQKGDFEVFSYPNVKTHELMLIEVAVPKRFQKTVDLTYIAESLTPFVEREILYEAEAFVSTDGRLAINVKLAGRRK